MVYFPPEIINIILSFIERPLTNKLIKYLIKECYKKDYNPYYFTSFLDDYRYQYSFTEWYFLYRKWWVLKNKQTYQHTPYPTYVGTDKKYKYID